MTGIAGIIAQSEEAASRKLDLMLESMEGRGSSKHVQIVKARDHVLAIGSCSHQLETLPKLELDQASLVLDGFVPGSLELEEVGGQIEEQVIAAAMGSPGSFSLLAVSDGRLLAARDVVGQKPLYFGARAGGEAGFSTLKNALTNVGIEKPEPVPPGKVVTPSDIRLTVVADKALVKPKETRVSETQASITLRKLLTESLSDSVPKDLALAFSGGLDSSIVARAAIENDLHPDLVTVGLKGQPELKHAQEVARDLGLNITVRELSQRDVLESLSKVVHTVESIDPVLVGVSVPLFFACEVAEEMGSDCLLAGQLSDELFAGYGRFDRLAQEKNFRAARDEVWNSVVAASANDFDPGDKLAVSHRLALRCPFAFLPLVQYALRLPISLKLKVLGERVVRKYILRRLASDWKLPETVVNRPKKAVQYSSGIQKVLLKEAKRKGTTLRKMLEHLSQ